MIKREGAERFSCAREALWALLADTDRLNRDLKLPPVAYAFLPRSEGGAYLRGEAKFGPLTIRYEEEPYCWVRPARWQVRRVAGRVSGSFARAPGFLDQPARDPSPGQLRCQHRSRKPAPDNRHGQGRPRSHNRASPAALPAERSFDRGATPRSCPRCR